MCLSSRNAKIFPLRGPRGALRAARYAGRATRAGVLRTAQVPYTGGQIPLMKPRPAWMPASQPARARARASSPAHPPMAAATMIMRAHGGGGTLTARVYRTCRPPKSQPLPVRSTRWVARARPSSIDRGESLAGAGRAVPAGRGAGRCIYSKNHDSKSDLQQRHRVREFREAQRRGVRVRAKFPPAAPRTC